MQLRKLLRPRAKNNLNNQFQFEILLTLVSVGLSIYTCIINKRNLYYDAQNAESSRIIAEQLRTLNASNFMYELNCKLNEERKK